jgi:ribonucleoside-diphosphate reductase alpha chain
MPLEGSGSAGGLTPDTDDELPQAKPAAKKAGGQNVSLEAKAESGSATPKAAATSRPADSRQPIADSRASNGNGNGHAKNGNGTTSSLQSPASSLYSAKLLERAGVMLKTEAAGPNVRSEQFAQFQIDAPACDNCGAITVRNGNCYLCHNCGNSMGCS